MQTLEYMDFSIVTDTAGARVYELGTELIEHLEPRINANFKNIDVEIGIGIRCLPDSYNRRSFVRYTPKDNCLTIDFSVSLEEYEKMYKIEQRFNLGNTFLFWLDKGLTNKSFSNYNSDLNKENFLEKIKEYGKEIGWFEEEVDYSQDLSF